MAVRLISGLLSTKTFDSYLLDMMCVVFMKNFLLADSSELFMMYALFMKIFISLDGIS